MPAGRHRRSLTDALIWAFIVAIVLAFVVCWGLGWIGFAR